MKIKIQQINIDIFPNQIFVWVNKLFALIYLNRNTDVKWFDARKYYLPKGIIKYYNVIINVKNFYDEASDSNIKQYNEIRKLTKGQGEDYTTGCLLDYDYIKNRYKLTAADLSRLKALDANRKAIHLIEFVGQLKKLDGNYNPEDTGNDQSINNFRKNQRNETKIFSRKCNSLLKDGSNNLFKISRFENKLKSAVKYKTETILRIN